MVFGQSTNSSLELIPRPSSSTSNTWEDYHIEGERMEKEFQSLITRVHVRALNLNFCLV